MCNGSLTAERRIEDDSMDSAKEDGHHGPSFMQISLPLPQSRLDQSDGLSEKNDYGSLDRNQGCQES